MVEHDQRTVAITETNDSYNMDQRNKISTGDTYYARRDVSINNTEFHKLTTPNI